MYCIILQGHELIPDCNIEVAIKLETQFQPLPSTGRYQNTVNEIWAKSFRQIYTMYFDWNMNKNIVWKTDFD